MTDTPTTQYMVKASSLKEALNVIDRLSNKIDEQDNLIDTLYSKSKLDRWVTIMIAVLLVMVTLLSRYHLSVLGDIVSEKYVHIDDVQNLIRTVTNNLTASMLSVHGYPVV
jgi:hypothetical protein